MKFSRKSLAFLFLSLCTPALSAELIVMSASVHRDNMRGTHLEDKGIDVLAPFETANDVTVTHIVMPSSALQDALARMGSMKQTEEDLIYMSQGIVSPRVANFLAPLDDLLREKPIPQFPENWNAAAVAAGNIDGHQYMIPVRCGTFHLWANGINTGEAGVGAMPRTPEELYDFAKRSTFTRPSGEQVFGFAARGSVYNLPQTLAMMARMNDGDIVDPEGRPTVNSEPVIAAVELLRRMYVEGIMPPDWTTLDPDQLYRDGRLSYVISVNSFSFAGAAPGVADASVSGFLPLIESARTPEHQYAAGVLFYWGVGILNGSTDKDLAYEFLRHISSTEAQKGMANNENAPCTADVLAELVARNPVQKVGADTLLISKTPLPPHDMMNEATDMIGQAVQDMVVNGLPIRPTLDQLQADLEGIMG